MSPKPSPASARPWTKPKRTPGSHWSAPMSASPAVTSARSTARASAPSIHAYGVTMADMQRALEGARAVPLPKHQEVIHTIAREWIVDGQPKVQHPLGMSAYRLEVDAHIVTGSSTGHQQHHAMRARPKHRDRRNRPRTAGGQRSRVAARRTAHGRRRRRYRRRHHRHRHLLGRRPLSHHRAGHGRQSLLTNDIAMGLHAPFETAEELKLRYGSVLPGSVPEDDKVWASVFGEKAERSFSRRFIAEILGSPRRRNVRDHRQQAGRKRLL